MHGLDLVVAVVGGEQEESTEKQVWNSDFQCNATNRSSISRCIRRAGGGEGGDWWPTTAVAQGRL